MADGAKPTPKLTATITKTDVAKPAKPPKEAPSRTQGAGKPGSGCAAGKGKKPDGKKGDKKSPPLQAMQPKPDAVPGAPSFAPKLWQGAVQKYSNCYQYAVKYPTNKPRFPADNSFFHNPLTPSTEDTNFDPGEFHSPGRAPGFYSIDDIKKGAIGDGLKYGGSDPKAVPTAPPGYYPVAVFVSPSGIGGGLEYDWARQDADGTWSHKPGTGDATKLTDKDGKPVTNPNDSPWYPDNGYNQFGGWFFAPSGGMSKRY